MVHGKYSVEKTNYVLFQIPNILVLRKPREIKPENMVIKRVDVVKYLGVTAEEKLTWNSHVEYICNSLIFCIFNQLRNKVTTNTVRQLYHAFIY